MTKVLSQLATALLLAVACFLVTGCGDAVEGAMDAGKDAMDKTMEAGKDAMDKTVEAGKEAMSGGSGSN